MSFTPPNEELDSITKEIELVSHQVDIAREAYLIQDEKYENEFACTQLTVKANNPDATQTDIKAEAVKATHAVRLEVIKADSVYKAAQNRLRALRDRLDALREISFNLRAESKIR